MLETIHQKIDILPTEAQELLLDFIHILKKRYVSRSQPLILNNLPLKSKSSLDKDYYS
jgi:hypothetical protein